LAQLIAPLLFALAGALIILILDRIFSPRLGVLAGLTVTLGIVAPLILASRYYRDDDCPRVRSCQVLGEPALLFLVTGLPGMVGGFGLAAIRRH
jgi:hypothetical protein